MDLAEAMAPKSDQMNGDDLLTGPRTVTIKAVRIVGGQQPVHVSLEEFPRPWKPCKSMLRVMADRQLFGPDETQWPGHRVSLYRNADVMFGDDKAGGIRISHADSITKRTTIVITVSKGRKAPYVVEPLPDDAPSSPVLTETEVRIAALQTEWQSATPERKAAIQAEVADLRAGPVIDPGDIPTPDPADDATPAAGDE